MDSLLPPQIITVTVMHQKWAGSCHACFVTSKEDLIYLLLFAFVFISVFCFLIPETERILGVFLKDSLKIPGPAFTSYF